MTTVTFPASTGAITVHCPDTTSIVFATPAIAIATTCAESSELTLNFACPTTAVFTCLGPATASVSVDCSLVTVWKTGGATTSTSSELPVYTGWLPDSLTVPKEDERDEPEEDDEGVHVPCNSWFFFLCISWPTLKIRSWYWILQPGIYGPGPPPINLLRLPSGVTIKGNMPNWPKITIWWDHKLTTQSEPECETQMAEACTTTYYVTEERTTSSKSQCETIKGCSVSVLDSTTDVVIGTQTGAPIGTWGGEIWATITMGDAYTNSVFEGIRSRLDREAGTAGGTIIDFVPGPTVRPTYSTGEGGSACGATIVQLDLDRTAGK